MQMQLASSAAFPEPLLAAMPQLKEKPHMGVPSKNPALYQGHEVCNSTTALGLQAALHLERIRSRYTGKERDTESGNDYFGARYYASSMGRFMSPDWSAKEDPVPYAKMDDPQTLNLYAYVRNNPLGGVDADGHCANDDLRCQQNEDWAKTHYESSPTNPNPGNVEYEKGAQQQNAGGASTPPGTPYSPINLGSTTITGTFDPFYGNLGAKGATIYADPSNCGSCEWIQGVKSTDTDGGKQFIDGHEVMGSVPLYPRQGGPTNELNDQPYRHGAVTWTAISVVGAVDNANHSFTAMGAIKWGFSISASGRLSISGPVRASAAEERGVLRQVMKEYTWTIR
jgi:RHS repeat-associated protein